MKSLSKIIAAVLFAVAISINAFAQNDKKLTLDLFLDWEYVLNPQISPVWSPDGKRLAFIAPGQPQGAQIFVKWMDTGGEATQLTRLERAPSNITWSPDGKKIAFNMLVPAKFSMRPVIPSRPDGAKWVEAPRFVDRLNYRSDGSGYNSEGYTHIFTIAEAGGVPRQITDGDFNHNAPEWMPDSNTIVFSGVRKADAEYIRFGQEIYSANLQTNQIKALTDRDGQDVQPQVSPNGKFIAYTGSDRNDDTYNVSKLYLMNADGSNKRVLTENFDRAPFGLMWADDGSGVYFSTEDKGTNNLYFSAVSSNAPRQITTGNHQFLPSSISNNGIVAGILSDAKQTGDVVVFNVKNPTPRKITDVNGDLMEGRKLGEVEEIWYDSVGGMKVQGWIVKPPDFDAAKKYPLILYIHGGPHAMYGVGFNFEFQNHAAEGYVVLYTNPRGSTGYGKAFGNAINNAYPGQDYDDLINGVDAVIKRGYIDEKNLFVTGGSGGGVLTAWIVGHTDRFAAAVSMKPVVNWYSFVGTTDGADWYYNFKKLPWDDASEHIRRSPITYVGNVKTPTMVLTGDLDLRTPLEQTEQYFRALKLRKVPTAMVRLNGEFHGFNALGLRHPSNRLYQISYLRMWFEKYKRK